MGNCSFTAGAPRLVRDEQEAIYLAQDRLRADRAARAKAREAERAAKAKAKITLPRLTILGGDE
jgi:hypothetical protein